MSKALFIGGAAATTAGLAYAAFRYGECGGAGPCSIERPKMDLASDIVGWGMGGGALAVATFMYFTSGDEERRPPANLTLRDGGLQLSVVGSF